MILLEIAKAVKIPQWNLLKEHLEMAAQKTLIEMGIDREAELTIVLESEDAIRRLNRQFLGLDKPTDVLAFPAGDIDPETGHTILGDVVIAYSQACNQAQNAGNSITEELTLLVVHGVLHLLGLDHNNNEKKERMWLAQRRVLDQLGIKISILDG